MAAQSPGHHYGTRSKDSQELASQSPPKTRTTGFKGGGRKASASARSSGAFSGKNAGPKPPVAPPGVSVADDDDDVMIVEGEAASDDDMDIKYELQLWMADENGKKDKGSGGKTFAIDRASMRELFHRIAECQTEAALREVMVSIARDGSSPMFAEDVEVDVIAGYRTKASNSREMNFLGDNDMRNRLTPARKKNSEKNEKNAVDTIFLFAKFTVRDRKSAAAGGTKRGAAAAATGKAKKGKLKPGVTSTASGKSVSRSYGLGDEDQGIPNEENTVEALKRMHGKKYDVELYKAWATLLQWGEANDMYTPPKNHPKWLAVEQTLAAKDEGVHVPPSNSGRGGGAAGFNAAFMPGGGAAAGYGGAGTFGAGAFGAFSATPNAFGAGAFPYQQAYAPHTPFFPQMQQQVPPGYQQMHPQQSPFGHPPPFGFNPHAFGGFTNAPPPPPPQNPGGIPGSAAPGARGGGAGASQHHMNLKTKTKMKINTRRTGFRHGHFLERGDVVFVQEDQGAHFKVFKFPNDGTGAPVYFKVKKKYLDAYESDDAGDETSSSDEDEGSDSE